MTTRHALFTGYNFVNLFDEVWVFDFGIKVYAKKMLPMYCTMYILNHEDCEDRAETEAISMLETFLSLITSLAR